MLLLAYKKAKILIEVINMTNDEKMLQMLEALTGEVKSINTRLDKIETRLDNMDTRFDKIEARLDNMEARLDNMQHDIKSGFDMLGSFVNEIEKATTETEKRFNRLKQAI
jgi:tetrahydromethanopterin S-methyltransferase subunit G